MKLKTYLTILVEVHEEIPGVPGQIDVEERYMAHINRAMMQVPEVQKTQLVRSQVFFTDPMTEGIALRACPFCGKIFPVHTEECSMDPCESAECEYRSEGHAWRVLCDPDRGGCGVSTIWTDDREDAAEDWNRRADDE